MPKLSVIMGVYNGEPYLRDAIDSVLGQTFEAFEFILIDDGSTDATFGDDVQPVAKRERQLGCALRLALPSARLPPRRPGRGKMKKLKDRLKKYFRESGSHPMSECNRGH